MTNFVLIYSIIERNRDLFSISSLLFLGLKATSSFGATDTSTVVDASDVIQLPEDGNIDALLVPGPSASTANRVSTPYKPIKSYDSSGLRRRSVDSEDSDSGHNPNTFSDEVGALVRTMSSLSGLTFTAAAASIASGGESVAGSIQNTPDRSAAQTALDAEETASTKNPYRMKAHEALQIGLILSQQEQQFGTNMYQSLTPDDEPEIERLNGLGFSTEEAILKIFQKRYQPDLVDHEVSFLGFFFAVPHSVADLLRILATSNSVGAKYFELHCLCTGGGPTVSRRGLRLWGPVRRGELLQRQRQVDIRTAVLLLPAGVPRRLGHGEQGVQPHDRQQEYEAQGCRADCVAGTSGGVPAQL
jgi:hypothetical protein